VTKIAYLLRFDDMCATMNWHVWNQIESVLDLARIRPIVAVIPDNQDASLKVDVVNPLFWDRVRAWQEKGWTIALHGYQHRYVNSEPGLLGLSNKSEFAGLTYDEQHQKLESALIVFRRENVRVDAWIAPSHSFDELTLRNLRELGIKVISDGLWRRPVVDDNGLIWIPQQLWKFQKKSAGVWTICTHHNSWTTPDFANWSAGVVAYRDRISSVPEVLVNFGPREIRLTDRLHAAAAMLNIRMRHRLFSAVESVRSRV
jgi:predicted deacetylase